MESELTLMQSGLVGVWSSLQAQLLIAKQTTTPPQEIREDQRLVFSPDGTGRIEYYEMRAAELELVTYGTFLWQLQQGTLILTAGLNFLPQYGLVENQGFMLQDITFSPSAVVFPVFTYSIREELLEGSQSLAVVTFDTPLASVSAYGRYRYRVYPIPTFSEALRV